MKTVLTTYIPTVVAVKIHAEAESLGISKSDYLARMLASEKYRRVAQRQIRRQRARETITAARLLNI
jgi:hypothetical protein